MLEVSRVELGELRSLVMYRMLECSGLGRFDRIAELAGISDGHLRNVRIGRVHLSAVRAARLRIVRGCEKLPDPALMVMLRPERWDGAPTSDELRLALEVLPKPRIPPASKLPEPAEVRRRRQRLRALLARKFEIKTGRVPAYFAGACGVRAGSLSSVLSVSSMSLAAPKVAALRRAAGLRISDVKALLHCPYWCIAEVVLCGTGEAVEPAPKERAKLQNALLVQISELLRLPAGDLAALANVTGIAYHTLGDWTRGSAVSLSSIERLWRWKVLRVLPLWQLLPSVYWPRAPVM